MSLSDPRRHLPSVESVRLDSALSESTANIRQEIVVQFIRSELDLAREAMDAGPTSPSAHDIAKKIAKTLSDLVQPSPRRVINATGVILHTGLGRSPLSNAAIKAITEAARNCNLELDLNTGERGDRQLHVENLLTVLTRAEAALVVNNNAAALYLTLNALAHRREVIVSRGQLIEIGGSFRLPQIMERAGVKLIEVGTTNRTRIQDYRDAITDKTALLLRAYPSNYRVDGFQESVSIAELAALGQEKNIIVADDLGGGLLWDWTNFGLPYEPTVRESIEAGVDLVLVSGDKVLGGPQSGIILGKKPLVTKLKKSPLARVVRADKLSLAALNATLIPYLSNAGPQESVPVWQMLTANLDSLRTRAEALVAILKPISSWKCLEVVSSSAETGSGTLPATDIASIAIRAQASSLSAARFAKRLRATAVPVVCTIREESLFFDLRTLSVEDERDFINSVSEALSKER